MTTQTASSNPARSARFRLLSAGFYLAVFFALFLQFPLKRALPGNCDSWIGLAYTNYLMARAEAWLTGTTMGLPMYPVPDALAYGEASWGFLLYMPFKLVGMPDHWAYYGFISLIFALNGLSFTVLASRFLTSRAAVLFGGFAFSLSNMAFAHIDDSVLFFYALPFLSTALLVDHFRDGSTRAPLLPAVLLGLQIYVSVYVFVYSSLMVAVFFLFLARRHRIPPRTTLLRAAQFAVPYLVLVVPNFAYRVHAYCDLCMIAPWDTAQVTQWASMEVSELLLALPDNRVYGWILDSPPGHWGATRKHNLVSLGVLVLAAHGAFTWRRQRRLLLTILGLGALLAAGPHVMWRGEMAFPSPVLLLYEHVPLLSFLRIPSRAFFLSQFALCLFAAYSVGRLRARLPSHKAAIVPILLLFPLHFFENVPLPMKAFSVPDARDPAVYETIRGLDADAVVAELPTLLDFEYLNWDGDLFADPAAFVHRVEGRPDLALGDRTSFDRSWDDTFQYNREVMYLDWQASHRLHSVSGVNGYIPTPRMIYQRHLHALPAPAACEWLVAHGVRFLVFHRDMVIEDDRLRLADLEGARGLRRVYDDGVSAVFALEGPFGGDYGETSHHTASATPQR